MPGLPAIPAKHTLYGCSKVPVNVLAITESFLRHKKYRPSWTACISVLKTSSDATTSWKPATVRCADQLVIWPSPIIHSFLFFHYIIICVQCPQTQKKRTRNNFCPESPFHYWLLFTSHDNSAHGCTCKKHNYNSYCFPLRTLFMIVMTFCFFFTRIITFFFIAVSKHDPVWCHEHYHTQEKELCGTWCHVHICSCLGSEWDKHRHPDKC